MAQDITTVRITRELTPELVAQVVALRAQWIYPLASRRRYRVTGLREALSASDIRARHAADPGSWFLFALNESGGLVGYMRGSIVEPGTTEKRAGIDCVLAPELRQAKVLDVAVIAIKPECIGLKRLVEGDSERRPFAQTIYERFLQFGADRDCALAVADIYIAPETNVRSLGLHRRLGFQSLGHPLAISNSGGCEIHSLRVTRPLTPGQLLQRRGDKLWELVTGAV